MYEILRTFENIRKTKNKKQINQTIPPLYNTYEG